MGLNRLDPKPNYIKSNNSQSISYFMINDGVIINDVLVDPTGAYVKNYLFSLAKETPFLDYKKRINIEKNSDFPKFVKDALAFTNYGGGFIFLGMEENQFLDPDVKGKFLPTGLPTHFHIDQATLQQKTNSYTSSPITFDYDEFFKTVDGESRKFAITYVRPSTEIIKPIKDGTYEEGGKTKSAFKQDTIYTRRGTQSIPASALEIDWISERVSNEQYKISVLSGEPDKIEEPLYSNLFEVKKFPDKVYIGNPKFFNHDEIISELKNHIKYPFEKFRFYENKLITLQNLNDPTNPYRNLVDPSSVYTEYTTVWLGDKDKKNVLVSLLNKEIIGKALKVGMWYNKKTNKLFFSSENQKRYMSWPSKFRASRRSVANQVYASQLKAEVFLHPAFRTTFVDIGDEFFLQINPTFIISIDGKQVISGLKEGTIITKLSYNKYNDAHLNNILFWSNKLGNGDDIKILDDFIVSCDPVKTSIKFGISWDIPTTELKYMIENYKPETEDEQIDMEVTSDEFIV